jgi:AbiTii
MLLDCRNRAAALYSSAMNLISKLQLDALNPDIPVSHLLRAAKVVATKLDLKDALLWIDCELTGYVDVKNKDLPPYRQLRGEPKGWNPHHGWQPIYFPGHPELARSLSQAPIGQPLAAIEHTLSNRDKGPCIFALPPEMKADLIQALQTDVHMQLTYEDVSNIIDQVRNLILNWSLELEKAGIAGENMTFTAEEKREAGPVTQHFFIQNVGVLGDVSDRAQVTNQQTALAALDLGKVRDFVTQARGALDLLPAATRREVEPVLVDVETELNSATPDRSKLSRLLGSMRSICEGAAGNLGAEGIMQLLRVLTG